MMQILGIRKFLSKKNYEKGYDAFFEKKWRASNLEQILKEYPILVEKIPTKERHNIYFTVAHCLEKKGRKLLEQWYIPFDIDKVSIVGEKPTQLELDSVINVVADVLKINKNDLPSIFSGNGFWFFIKLKTPITDEKYFSQTRNLYGELCREIDLALKRKNVAGSADRSVWSTARLARMPGTINIKPDKPQRTSFVINDNCNATADSFEELCRNVLTTPPSSGLVTIQNKKPHKYEMKSIFDKNKGCQFLRWCIDFPDEVNEPQWYAMLSITGRLQDGRNLSHEISSKYSKYNYAETDLKLDRALEHGPRTCKNIATLSDQCESCIHHKTTLSTPIQIEEVNLEKRTKFILKFECASDLCAEPSIEVPWLLKDTLPSAGTSLLVSKPKVGKTTLARYLALAVAKGEKFLNRETDAGTVLYIAAEENREQFKKLLRKLNAEQIKNVHFHIGPVPIDALKQLDSAIELIRPKLVIIDTMIRVLKVKDTNNYAEMAEAMAPVYELSTKHNTHIMILHHAGKSDPKELGDATLGSTVIFGSVDTGIRLAKKDNKVTICTDQRYGTSIEWSQLQFNSETLQMSLGQKESESRNADITARIINFIKDNPGCSPDDIHEGVVGHKKMIGYALKQLRNNSDVLTQGKGIKGSPFRFSYNMKEQEPKF